MDFTLELVLVPVADVDRANRSGEMTVPFGPELFPEFGLAAIR